MTTVIVPDIDILTMNLILRLAYQDQVQISMKRIKDVGEYLTLFGMEWKNFSFVEKKGKTVGNLVDPPNIDENSSYESADDKFPDRKLSFPARKYPGPKENHLKNINNTPPKQQAPKVQIIELKSKVESIPEGPPAAAAAQQPSTTSKTTTTSTTSTSKNNGPIQNGVSLPKQEFKIESEEDIDDGLPAESPG